MTVKIDSAEPNVFPVVEKLDVHDAGRGVTLTLATKIDGHLVPVSVHLDFRLGYSTGALPGGLKPRFSLTNYPT